MLLVLDNCEHVLPAAIRSCRQVHGGYIALQGCLRRAANRSAPPPSMSCGLVRWPSLKFWPCPDGRSGREVFRRSSRSSVALPNGRTTSSLMMIMRGRRPDLPLARRPSAGDRTGGGPDRQVQPRELVALLDQKLGFRAPSAEGAPPARMHETLMATIDWSFRSRRRRRKRDFFASLVGVQCDAFDAEDAVFVAEAAGAHPGRCRHRLGSLVAKSSC